MTTIQKHTGNNLGSILKVEYALAKNVSDFPNIAVNNEIANSEITITGDWQELYFTPSTAKYDENQKDTDSGEQFNNSLSFKAPKNRPELNQFIDVVRGFGCIFKITDANGAIIVVGTPEEPLYFSSKKYFPESVEGYNGIDISFTGATSEQCIFITS